MKLLSYWLALSQSTSLGVYEVDLTLLIDHEKVLVIRKVESDPLLVWIQPFDHIGQVNRVKQPTIRVEEVNDVLELLIV